MSPQAVPSPVHERYLPAPPQGLPRLLMGIRHDRALALEEHEAVHGALPRVRSGSRSRVRQRSEALISEVELSGLLGRGGAAFPLATKLRAVARSSGKPIVVVNAVEAEPASVKDRALLEALPHLVLDGATLAAECLGASEAIVALNEHADVAAREMQAAILERVEREPGRPDLSIVSVPARYVAGHESALVHHLNGGPAKPTFTPPLPFERGVRRRPTLVSNAETLAHFALIARHGAPWFRELGIATQPGSTLVTVSGAFAQPGVYEIEPGAALSSLLETAGGTTSRPAALLLGGYGGSWIAPAHLPALALSNEQLAHFGASLGAGVLVLLSEEACPVREAARLARWLADESARQCGPCMFGLPALADLLERMADGAAEAGSFERVQQLCSVISRRGACAHPDLAIHTVASSLSSFEREFHEHARGGACARCHNPPELDLPMRVHEAGRAAPRRAA